MSVNGLIPIFVDFETFYSSKDGYTLSKMSVVEYVRDSRFKAHGVGVSWPGVKRQWLNSWQEMLGLDWKNAALIAHNAKFDGFIATEVLGVKPALYVDTLGMSKAVLGSSVASHSLDALAQRFDLPRKGIMKTDGIRDLSPEQEKELADYCLHDVYLLEQIFARLSVDFPASQWKALDWTVRAFCEPKLELNHGLLAKGAEDEAKRREAFFVSPMALEAAAAVQPEPALTKTGKPRKTKVIEPKKAFASNDLFPRVLAHFGYETPMKPSPSALKKGETLLIPALALGDEEFVEMLESEDEKLSALCEARVAAKSTLLETRAGKLARIGKTGPWPFDVGFSGAAQTHRFSGGPGAGGNPQNFPAKKESGRVIRQSVEAPEDYSLVVGDFAAIEARIAAFLAKEAVQTAIFRENGDPYTPFASTFYGRPITKEDKLERGFGKAAILGCQYGMGAKKFMKHVKTQTGREIDYEAAKAAIDLYRQTYGAIPALWKYLDGLLALMAGGGSGAIHSLPCLRFDGPTIALPSGLKLKYPGLRKGTFENPKTHRQEEGFVYTAFRAKRSTPVDTRIWGGSLLENICQAIAGEICKEAIIALLARGWEVVGQVHDELLALAPEGDEITCAQDMQDAMSATPAWFSALRLNAEVGIAKNWLEAKA